MQEIIMFLVDNQEVLKLIVEGKANLVGVSAEEQKAIVETFIEGEIGVNYFWSP